MEKIIITIARQYGSGGRTVGKMLAERLQIPYYDREIISMASEDSGINAALFQDEKKVHSLQGIFIPAHIDKSHFSILSQLGFIPPSLQCDALELSPHTTYTSFIHNYDYLKNYPFIRSSDAHYLPDIGKVSTPFELDEISFSTIREAIHNSRF